MRAPLRPRLIAASLIAGLILAACQMQGPDEAPLATDEISVTSLDAPASEVGTPPEGPPQPDSDAPRPEPRPESPDEAADDTALPDDETPTEPEAPKSPEQLLCEKTGGQWAVAGLSGAYVCVTLTRDGGKVCRKKTDCQGLCLARSGTCAPIMPLFGCNEVLEKDGRRVTLCID